MKLSLELKDVKSLIEEARDSVINFNKQIKNVIKNINESINPVTGTAATTTIDKLKMRPLNLIIYFLPQEPSSTSSTT